MSCIGTAGHVDHGKSTLVQALTGIDPDRLAEEKARGMTIDLGFAWLTLPSGHEVSIVDVPGHENFIKNMLAGVGGIDAALLVVAADESVMPQTREHLTILNLLHVTRGVVALTKADLVDAEWLTMVQEEVTELLLPTTLADAPIIPVSAHTHQGLPDLITALDQILQTKSSRQNIARPRLPVDRVFSLTGFGTIVTGTLLDGKLKAGQEVEILPQGIKTRIRGLQSHKTTIETIQPGNRVAINLPNVARSDLQRGNVICLPSQLQATMLFDAHITLLSDASHTLAHNARVDFYCGTQEVPARVRLLDTEELQPGKSAWAQIRVDQPVVAARRDRFILRIPSPGQTIGGGEVVDVHPRYHRRFQGALLDHLAQLAQGTPEELVLAALDRQHRQPSTTRANHSIFGYEVAEITKQCNLATDVTSHILETLLLEGRVYKVGSLWFAQHVWEHLVDHAISLVADYHRQYPLRSGLSKEEWRARLRLTPKLATEIFAILQAQGCLRTVDTKEQLASRMGGLIRLPEFTPDFTPEQQRLVARLLRQFKAQPYTPPVQAEAEELVGAEVVNALIDQGQLVKVGTNILFLHETYQEACSRLIDYLRDYGTMTAADARDVLGTTRKYVLPLLEHLDALHITRRQGDERIAGPGAG